MDKIIEAIANNLGMLGLLVLLAVLATLSALREIARLRLEAAKRRSSDLLNRRFAAYGILWSRMEELAVYSESPFDATVAKSVRDHLRTWYFSAEGGMLLSATARDFYFAVQEILNHFAQAGLMAASRHADPRTEFLDILNKYAESHRECVEAFRDKRPETMQPEQWLDLCKSLAATVLVEVNKAPKHGSGLAFCVAQQASSALRSRLAFEVSSRLDDVPRWWRFW